MADVELEIEVGIIDPVRVSEVERHGHQAAAERRCQMNAAGEMVEKLLIRQWALQPARVEQLQGADRARSVRRIGVVHESVHRTQLSHSWMIWLLGSRG